MQTANIEQRLKIQPFVLLQSKWWPYTTAVLMIFIAKLPTLSNNTVFIDEPIYLAQAMRLNSFEAFVYAFQYRVETKFQLGLLPYVIAKIISFPNALLIVHIFGLLAMCAAACLLLAISHRIFNETLPGLVVLFLWCLFLNSDELAAATLLECFQTPLILMAFWLLITAIQKPNKYLKRLFWIGFFLGLATLVKPPALLLVPIFTIAFIILKLFRAKFLISNLAKFGSLLLCGWAIPIMVFVAPYFLTSSAMDALKFCLFQLTSTYATSFDPTQSVVRRATGLLTLFGPFNLTVIFTSIVIFVQKKIKRVDKWNETDKYLLLTQVVGWVLYVGYAVGQAKTHYLLPIMPFLFFLPSYQILTLLKKQELNKRVISIIFIVCICLISQFGNLRFYATLLFDNENFYASTQSNININALANYVDANSKPQDNIWVYYNVSELYWKANRRPATTEPTGTWLVEVYTPFWFSKIANELVQDKAELVIGIDSPRVGRPGAADLTELPIISDLLKQNYSCSRDVFPSITICKLK